MAASVTALFGDAPPGVDLAANREVMDDTVVITLSVLATLAVIYRLLSRMRNRKSIYRSDWFFKSCDGDNWLIIVALIGEYGTAACTLAGNRYGAGRHVWATNVQSLRKMAMALFIYPWLYVVATVGLKLSFCWTYMRIFNPGGTVRTTFRCRNILGKSLVTCVVASMMYSLSVWIPMTVACQPIEYFWNQYTNQLEGTCLDYLSMWIITGIFSAILDLLILVIPIQRTWCPQMDWKKKAGVVAILALGSFVIAAAVVRLLYMTDMLYTTDITWALGPAQIWTSLEPSLGIVSSCLITTFGQIRKDVSRGRAGIGKMLAWMKNRKSSPVEEMASLEDNIPLHNLREQVHSRGMLGSYYLGSEPSLYANQTRRGDHNTAVTTNRGDWLSSTHNHANITAGSPVDQKQLLYGQTLPNNVVVSTTIRVDNESAS